MRRKPAESVPMALLAGATPFHLRNPEQTARHTVTAGPRRECERPS